MLKMTQMNQMNEKLSAEIQRKKKLRYKLQEMKQKKERLEIVCLS